ncbi:MAG TPA: FmdB family zinc ribbon protein [Gemmatimonadales bacterium]|nr:FmdB family zinc ribbon protein [Gemmatimonadales bacterium]
MPTYEYQCPSGHVFEKFSPTMTSAKSATCPKCGKRAKRLISGGAGLVFKGSGFYITDYKRAGEKKETAAEPKTESKPAAESKPAKPKTPSTDK